MIRKPREVCFGSVLKELSEQEVKINPREEFIAKDCGDYFLFGLKKRVGEKE